MKFSNHSLFAATFLCFASVLLSAQQPTTFGTALVDGSYASYDLVDKGVFRQVRLQATISGAGLTRNWNFAEGIAGAQSFSNNWRPWSGACNSNPDLQIAAYNQVIAPDATYPAGTASATFNSGFGGCDGFLPDITAGRYYTVNITEGSGDNHMAILETTYNPREIVNVSAQSCAEGCNYPVSVTLDGPLAPGEYVYLRYSIDGFLTSQLALFLVNGATGTTKIPDQGNVSVSYYIFTSSKHWYEIIDATDIFGQLAYDMFTLELENNGGSNYNYTQCLKTKHTVTDKGNYGPGTLRFMNDLVCPGDTICFDPSLDGDTIKLGHQLWLNKNLVIIGNDSSKTILDGDGHGRVVGIGSGTTVELWRMTMQNGLEQIFGGGIGNFGHLKIIESQIMHNRVLGIGTISRGGGIYSQGGSLEIVSSRISVNEVSTPSSIYQHSGGGIYNVGGNLIINSSTISNNKVFSSYLSYGGGISNYGGDIIILNSTISKNSVETTIASYTLIPTAGGGVLSEAGSAKIISSTIAGNTSIGLGWSVGGGIAIASNPTTIISSTISDNHTSWDSGDGVFNWLTSLNIFISVVWGNGNPGTSDIYGSIHEMNHSLVEGLYPAGTGNLDGTDPSNNPVLGLLSDNGGPTKTMAIDCFSPVFNAAHPDSTGADQRGVSVQYDRKDMGAFEYEGGPDNDDDTSPQECDCDDNNPYAFPGASELCDNVDNDCDGELGLPDVDGYCCSYGWDNIWYIQQVQAPLSEINNVSGNDLGYGDYSSEVLTVNPYYPYIYLILYPGGSFTMKHWQVYADWDKDSVFSSAEKVLDQCTMGPFGQFIQVPAGFTGSSRLRIVMKKVNVGCSSGDIPTDACGEIGEGEVEDYTVQRLVPLQMENEKWKMENENFSLQVYPNPFADEFMLAMDPSLKLKLHLELKLINAQGQTVIRRKESNNGQPLRIDARSLAAGTYFLRVNTGEEVVVKTIVKQ